MLRLSRCYIKVFRRGLTTAFCDYLPAKIPLRTTSLSIAMKYLAVICLALVGVASAGILAPATTLVRTPNLDSAVIKSERLGGNFAYSSVEGHSYAALTPVVRHVATPVAVSYSAPLVAPAIVAAPAYAHPYPLHYPITFAHPTVIGEAAPAPAADAAPVESAPAAAEPASDTVEVEAA
ncbi:hypothetical protein J437_LFUL016923 [Ladona fulva]|uniref:Uncharacterized protein n=1 Tax=Ladona fulva TaxID=123851 RepID=A0A8K0KRE2_LADFU|nr:hypothetical protein J437_LFUL016923 [Ladona fulva]